MTSKIKNILKDKKAQVDAPFEVLVAVILMGFVILAGSYALKNLSQNICIGDKRQDISNFKNALRDVVLGSDLTFKNFYFRSRACFNEQHEVIRIVTYTDPHRCAAYCQTLSNTCTLIEYFYDDGRTSIHPITPICTDLPTTVEFANDYDGENICGTLDSGETLLQEVNGMYILKPGYYRLFRQTMSDNQTTKICAIVKTS
jgi:uncharacterized protein (UPF0333 family)